MLLKHVTTHILLILSAFLVQSKAYLVHPELPEVDGDKFYYFGYGSNMLTQRIHMQNPTAERIGAGIVQDYRLDFNTYTERWRGAPATIVPTVNATVYGTLWSIDLSNLDDIDNQEGVPQGIYEAISIPVQTLSGASIMSRVYLLIEQPKTPLKSYLDEEVPEDRQPSKTYLQCLVKGAIETELPIWYVNDLKSVKHNGNIAKDMEEKLELENVKLNN